MFRRILFLLFLIQYQNGTSLAQIHFLAPSDTVIPSRVKLVTFGTAGTYAAGMTGLYRAWYKGYNQSAFHFFNDADEWAQHDKIGHVASCYYLSRWGMEMYRWAGLNQKKSVWIGGTAGTVFLVTIEVFDGFSDKWGFSVSDLAADITGAAIAISQQLIWDEQRITFKFSYRKSNYAQFRPDAFGTTIPEQLFKDYNGQTYWLSGNIKSFQHPESSMPPWLNIAVGYGIDGFTGAFTNITEFNENPVPSFSRIRQFYISPDVDFTRIKSNRKGLKLLFSVLGFIKMPSPALEINTANKVRFHWLFF